MGHPEIRGSGCKRRVEYVGHPALGSSGAKGLLETAGKWINLGLDEAEKFGVDAALAGAESINCAIPSVP